MFSRVGTQNHHLHSSLPESLPTPSLDVSSAKNGPTVSAGSSATLHPSLVSHVLHRHCVAFRGGHHAEASWSFSSFSSSHGEIPDASLYTLRDTNASRYDLRCTCALSLLVSSDRLHTFAPQFKHVTGLSGVGSFGVMESKRSNDSRLYITASRSLSMSHASSAGSVRRHCLFPSILRCSSGSQEVPSVRPRVRGGKRTPRCFVKIRFER